MSRRQPLLLLLVGLLLALAALAGCGSENDSGGSGGSADTADKTTAEVPQINVDRGDTVGPNGESAVPASDVTLTEAQIAELKKGDHTAAIVWHLPGLFVDAVDKQLRERLDELGIELIAETNAEGDPAQQQSDLETVLARKPDVVISTPLDPVSSAKAFRQALDQGTKLVFISNTPQGFKHGKDYVGVVSSDVRQMARRSAQLLANDLGGKGKLGFIYHDADFFITNQWDEVYKETIEKEFPGIEIVAEQGFADPAKTEEVASAMLSQNPDLDAIWVTWTEPAEGVLAALRAQGRDDVIVSTVGVSEPIALDIAKKGPTKGVSVDLAPELATAVANEVGLAVLGETAPPFAVADAIDVTPENLVEGWEQAYGLDAPKALRDAAGQ